MKRAALTVAVAVLAIAGCSGDADNGDGERTHRGAVDGQNVRVDDPTAGDNGAVAVWFHGQGGRVDTRMNEDWLNALRADGWAVASGDLAGESWGNEAGVAAAEQLVDWAAAETGKQVRLVVAGSMGALPSLNAIARDRIVVPCWYGTMPVYDQRTVSAVPDADEQIEDAFGGPVPPDYIPAEQDLPPIAYAVRASPDDTWVPASENADRLAAAVGVEVIAASGEHGDASHFDDTDLTRFASTCLD